ncbi:hypothetical protein GGR58DRAFT_518361 [Xylaria digitata]|nr:hypothetical protein GGR58DRAFT_518361 [Xylaria digitata]
MTIAWVNLSTRWELTSVQAALGFIISTLGTAGIWSFSRYFWQRGSVKLIRGDPAVPLSTIFVMSGPGEVWDAISILRRKVLVKKRWNLILQLVVIVVATSACMFAGPIAKSSLRAIETVQKSELGILSATKGDSWTGNVIEAGVLWNETIQSMETANFPLAQLLDFLPPSTVPWTYNEKEWDATWSICCNNTDNVVLQDLVASGNHTFYHPIEAYEAFRNTYDPRWLDTSKYRYQVDFTGWFVNEPVLKLIDYYFFVLLISDPAIDDRMHYNNETMEMSFSILHLSDFNATNAEDVSFEAQANFKLSGPVGRGEFSRAECNFTRNARSAVDEDAVPWLWTNDTSAITSGYKVFWASSIGKYVPKDIPVPTPTSKDIIRLYQAYIISVNTVYSFPMPRALSIWKDTVQIATGVLIIVIALFIVILWSTARYFVFLIRHKGDLSKIYIPDSKLEWMVHGARIAAEQQVSAGDSLDRRDSDYFSTATFGSHVKDVKEFKRLDPMSCPIMPPRDSCFLAVPGIARSVSSSQTLVPDSEGYASEVSRSRSSSVRREEEESEVDDEEECEKRVKPLPPEARNKQASG